jgi:hypothetical protein
MGRPKVNLSRSETQQSVDIFFNELELPEGMRDVVDPVIFKPHSFGVVIGTEIERGKEYAFYPNKRVSVGEYGDGCVQGALGLAEAAVREDREIPGYASADGRGVAVSGFEERNAQLAQHILTQVVWAG